MQSHLILVDFPLVKNLINQKQQTLRIPVNRLNVFQTFLIADTHLQFLQGSHNQGQW